MVHRVVLGPAAVRLATFMRFTTMGFTTMGFTTMGFTPAPVGFTAPVRAGGVVAVRMAMMNPCAAAAAA